MTSEQIVGSFTKHEGRNPEILLVSQSSAVQNERGSKNSSWSLAATVSCDTLLFRKFPIPRCYALTWLHFTWLEIAANALYSISLSL